MSWRQVQIISTSSSFLLCNFFRIFCLSRQVMRQNNYYLCGTVVSASSKLPHFVAVVVFTVWFQLMETTLWIPPAQTNAQRMYGGNTSGSISPGRQLKLLSSSIQKELDNIGLSLHATRIHSNRFLLETAVFSWNISVWNAYCCWNHKYTEESENAQPPHSGLTPFVCAHFLFLFLLLLFFCQP